MRVGFFVEALVAVTVLIGVTNQAYARKDFSEALKGPEYTSPRLDLSFATPQKLFVPKDTGHYPIIFVHGLGVKGQIYEYFVPLKRILKKNGFDLHVAKLPFGGTIEEGAEALKQEIRRLVPDGKYHLVAHSRGGLISRYAISQYGLGDRCLSLTSLGTPHRGSPIADVSLGYLRKPAPGVIDKIAHKLADHFMRFSGLDQRSLEQLTHEYATQVFDPQNQDDPRVGYYSMAFDIPRPIALHTAVPAFWVTYDMIREREKQYGAFGGNDGLVSIYSGLAHGQNIGTRETDIGDHYSTTAGINTVWGGASTCNIFLRVTENLRQAFEPMEFPAQK